MEQESEDINSKRLQILNQIFHLFFAQAARAGDFLGGVRAGEQGFERIDAGVVQELDPLVDVAERRRVEALVAVAPRAKADVVYFAVGEVRAVVASRAAGAVAFEDLASPLGGRRERAVLVANGLGGLVSVWK